MALMRHFALLLAALTMLAAAPAAVGAIEPRAPTVRYRVARMAVDRAAFRTFAASVQDTLTDPRGWSAGGVVSFRQVSDDPDFTLWLASPAAIAATGVGCSEYYSCRVGDDVYINVTRWRDGADTYRQRSLGDYRDYVVNHEVGHWLGLGHRGCPGPGAASPVMQQQSKTLRGCEPQAWPLEGEQRRALRYFGPQRWSAFVQRALRIRGAISPNAQPSAEDRKSGGNVPRSGGPLLVK